MLVILEIEQIIGLPSYCDFGLLWNLDNCIMRRPFNDSEGKIGIDKACLKLVGAHFDDHFLSRGKHTW